MEFYWKKAKQIRLNKKLSIVSVAEDVGISRGTLWSWELGTRMPREKNIRKLSCSLRVPLNEISDLKENIEHSTQPLNEYTDAWEDFTLPASKWEADNINMLSKGVDSLINTLKRAFIITNALMNSTNAMIYIKDINKKYITANAAFLKHFGLTSSQRVIGLKDDDFFPSSDAKTNSEEDVKVLYTGEMVVRESYTPGTRNKKWSLITKKTILDSQGKVAGLIGCYVDISDRKKSERIRELLEINVKYMDCGLAIVDSNNNYLYINEAYARQYNILTKEHTFNNKLWISKLHPDNQAEAKEYSSKNSFPNKQIYRIIQTDGLYKWIEVVRSAIIFQGKKCLIIVSKDYHENIGKIEKLEEYLETLNKLSEEEKNKIIHLLE
ncbi:MAG TPA: PAS domain-containing protein [Victivallales bacterium]|nr:PAS domain-containing protein [Victivallales bacterium]